MMRNECFSDGYFEGQRWATTWTETCETEYGSAFVEGIKSALNEATLGYAIDAASWNEGFVYGARQVARDFVRYGVVAGKVSVQSDREHQDKTSESPVSDDSPAGDENMRLTDPERLSRLAA